MFLCMKGQKLYSTYGTQKCMTAHDNAPDARESRIPYRGRVARSRDCRAKGTALCCGRGTPAPHLPDDVWNPGF